MDTEQLIKASATVVTITTLREGSVYKRVETDYSGGASLRFGVVTSVMHNGTEGAIIALEYKPDYSRGVEVEQKVWDGTKPQALFAATPLEVRAHLDDLQLQVDRKVAAAAKALDDANEAADHVEELRRMSQSGTLSEPETVVGELVAAGSDAPDAP